MSTRGSLRLVSNKQNSLETRVRVDRAQTLEKNSHKQMTTKSSKLRQRDKDLFPEVHTRRCYVSVEEGFKRRCSRTPMLLSQGRDHLSSPRSYGFLGEEWSLQTSCAAHNLDWAITSTPSRLWAQGSKSNKLESADLTKTKCSRDGNETHLHESLLLLASHSNPSMESLKNGERGVRELFLALEWVQLVKCAREGAEGV